MTPRILLSCFAIFAFSGPALAEPMYFSGTESGGWLKLNRDGGVIGTTGPSLSLGANNTSLLYTANPGFNAPIGQPFKLGQFTLSNFSPSDIPAHSTLQVTLAFQTPNLGATNVDIATSFTLNSNGSLSASIVQGANTTLGGANGSQYELTILGFSSSSTWNNSATGTLKAPMCEANSSYIWAEITPTDPGCQTPEPSALALGAIGVGLVGLRWRRRTNA